MAPPHTVPKLPKGTQDAGIFDVSIAHVSCATLRDNDRALAAEHGIELDAQADGASSTDDDMMSTYEEEVLSTISSDDEGETRFESHELPEKLLSTKVEAREYNPEHSAAAEDEIQSKETLDELKRVSLILKEY
ncbi:hypothetical protein PG995_005653 [Apiospora arundinis]